MIGPLEEWERALLAPVTWTAHSAFLRKCLTDWRYCHEYHWSALRIKGGSKRQRAKRLKIMRHARRQIMSIKAELAQRPIGTLTIVRP